MNNTKLRHTASGHLKKKTPKLTFLSLLHQPAWTLIQNLDETALGQVTKRKQDLFPSSLPLTGWQSADWINSKQNFNPDSLGACRQQCDRKFGTWIKISESRQMCVLQITRSCNETNTASLQNRENIQKNTAGITWLMNSDVWDMTAKTRLINENGMKLNRHCLTKDKVVNCPFFTREPNGGYFKQAMPTLEINQTSNTSTEESVHTGSPCVTTHTNVLAIWMPYY
jgi:hypothetical protein